MILRSLSHILTLLTATIFTPSASAADCCQCALRLHCGDRSASRKTPRHQDLHFSSPGLELTHTPPALPLVWDARYPSMRPSPPPETSSSHHQSFSLLRLVHGWYCWLPVACYVAMCGHRAGFDKHTPGSASGVCLSVRL